jgi:hypothetical protein
MAAKVKFGADTTDFNRGLDRMQGQVRGLSNRLGSGLKSTFAGLGASLVAGFSLGSIKQYFDEFDRLGDLAQQTGSTAEEIQRIGMAAKLAGTDVETLDSAFTTATTRILKMRAGASEIDGEPVNKLAQGLKILGINAQQFTSSNLSGQFNMVGEASQRLGDQTKVNEALFLIFGNRAQQLIPIMQNFAQVKKDMMETPVISNEDIERIGQINDQFDKLILKFKTFAVEAALLPQKMSKELSKWADTKFFGSLLAGQSLKEAFDFARSNTDVQENWEKEAQRKKAAQEAVTEEIKKAAQKEAGLAAEKQALTDQIEKSKQDGLKAISEKEKEIAFNRLSAEEQIAELRKKQIEEEKKNTVAGFQEASKIGIKILDIQERQRQQQTQQPQAQAYTGVIADSLRRVGGGGVAVSGTIEIAKTTARNTERTARAAEGFLAWARAQQQSKGQTFK